jgi:hypothetical protein
MPRYFDGKLYSVITYEDHTPIADHPDFLEACTNNEIVEFKHHLYDHSINCLPNNIKFINLAMCGNFKKPLENLPASLIGLSLPRGYNQPLNYLPHGLKYIYFDEVYFNSYVKSIIECAPASLKYICTISNCFDMETQNILTTEKYSYYGNSLYTHKLFLEDIK